ncbi:MAG: helix-turn-helix domain-containing protein [Candidatus Cloacimonetes bacterium]|jgi:excisionase family DNA binding protein|nr:helix-turn-helix domain-containing protein [Candidatus Cloacimonadota bacterium]
MVNGKHKIEKSFMDVKEASEYLGVTKSTLYSWTHYRSIDFFKPKGKLYFRIDDLNKFVFNEKCYYKSESTIEQEAVDYLVSKKVSA